METSVLIRALPSAGIVTSYALACVCACARACVRVCVCVCVCVCVGEYNDNITSIARASYGHHVHFTVSIKCCKNGGKVGQICLQVGNFDMYDIELQHETHYRALLYSTETGP